MVISISRIRLWICTNMLVNDNEYGAPWNDQFYWITIEDDEGMRWDDLLTLSGPRDYNNDDLLKAAQGMFPGYIIVEIRPYEICR